jgi:adenylosuccinate lyase
MADSFSHDSFLSPFAWRYGTAEMRAIWSEGHKLHLWRRIWVALAEAQQAAGLVSAEQVADLRVHADQVDIARSHAIEAEIHHDLMAQVRAFAEQCSLGGGIIHLGATSTDIKDNAVALQLRQALDLILLRLAAVLAALATQIERWAETPVIAWTHLQPAEPTTLGYRLAQYGQDLLLDWAELQRVRDGIRAKGFKGAVGTSASYKQLLANSEKGPAEIEARVMATLGLEAFPVTTQTYPRKQDWLVLNALAGLAGSLYKFAFDLRLLQSPPLGEWAEPFGSKQVGSSAMPFKRNPINAETMDSLARLVAALPRVAWDNAAHSLLERTLDDSANRRIILPQAFLAVDELLRRAGRLMRGLRVNETAMARNLATYGTFAATELLLMELARAGADRQAMHEVIREQSMAAWAAIEAGESNPLAKLLAADPAVLHYLPGERVLELMDATNYVGDAPVRARALAVKIRDLQESLSPLASSP